VKQDQDFEALARLLAEGRRLLVLTGAGCSTPSGIPAYRDARGTWMRRHPVTWQSFRADPISRRRYWARSLIGWPVFSQARPNPAHRALAHLEQAGRLVGLITQNVDGLHQAAGHRQIIDLHGRLDAVICIDCGTRSLRRHLQTRLIACNPEWIGLSAAHAPDGDADLEDVDFTRFRVPDCLRCGGTLKPDVVLFGESVPPGRVNQANQWLEQSDGLLLVGTSLTVFSGFRYARRAAELGLPIAAINQGFTRADSLLAFKLDGCCAEVLPAIAGMV
jgi:NAD-dependent SIR2 family protein deacetylase